EWRGRLLPQEFDPLAAMIPLAKREGLTLLVSLNAFSEGHTMFSTGPGYARPELQTVIYDPVPQLIVGRGQYRLAEALNVMPKTDEQLGVFTNEASLPNPKEGLFAVTLRPDGTVVDGFTRGGEGHSTPTVPTGGSIVAGAGRAADFLKANAVPGSRVMFDTRAELKPISERPQQIPLMMNLHHPEVQRYALAIVEEIAREYAVDGILYDDRLRYSGLNGDFSPLARERFEAYVGQKLNWPDDVFKFTTNQQLTRGIRPGRYYDAWMLWRALQMRNWVALARERVKSNRRKALFGIYAGSWYGEYPNYGSNYGSPDLQSGFWFHTKNYGKTGFAPLLDLLVTGNYYPISTIHEAMSNGTPPGRTVEAGSQLSNAVARDDCWTYAGIMLSDYKGNKEAVERALVAACASSQGVMVFDLSHDIDPMWEVFERAFRKPAVAPHTAMNILDDVRRKRAKYDSMGASPRPVPIIGGSPGAGH
ncbi:MAG TPA: alpha amylase family protein, partial [Fimbriimonadaceae bacterium]|nr:alpha amylase family protein [Fimbriimonadaceae bacterium]